MMGLVGCLAYEFQVTLPVIARQGLHAGAAGYGFMTAAMGIGAVVGGLFVAGAGPHRHAARSSIAAAPSASRSLLAALAPNLPLELVALALAGGRASRSWRPATRRCSSTRRRRCAAA